jgi:hypothetical protein
MAAKARLAKCQFVTRAPCLGFRPAFLALPSYVVTLTIFAHGNQAMAIWSTQTTSCSALLHGRSFLKLLDVEFQGLGQSPPKFAMIDLFATRIKVLVCRECVCFGDTQEEGEAPKFPAIGPHDIVEVRHVVTAIVGNVHRT